MAETNLLGETIEPEATEPDEFISWMASYFQCATDDIDMSAEDCLSEARATYACVVADVLQCEFGDPRYGWTKSDAHEVAREAMLDWDSA